MDWPSNPKPPPTLLELLSMDLGPTDRCAIMTPEAHGIRMIENALGLAPRIRGAGGRESGEVPPSQVSPGLGVTFRHPQSLLRARNKSARRAAVVDHELGTRAGVLEGGRDAFARRLLEQSPRSIEQVAKDAGFGTPEALRRAFARRVRLSPSEYRARFGGPYTEWRNGWRSSLVFDKLTALDAIAPAEVLARLPSANQGVLLEEERQGAAAALVKTAHVFPTWLRCAPPDPPWESFSATRGWSAPQTWNVRWRCRR